MELDLGGGKRQNVHTKAKRQVDPDEDAKIDARKTFGLTDERLTGEQREQALRVAQENPGATIPKSMEGNFDDFEGLSLSDTERMSFAELHGKGQKTGFEHGQIITPSGKVFEFTSNDKNGVHMPLTGIEENGLKLYHNHTNDTPPSAEDFKKLINHQVDEVGVVTRNGDVFKISVGGGWVPSTSEFDDIVVRISNEANYQIIDQPEFSSWTLEERNYMAIREQAYRISREFEWKIEGGKLDE